MERVNRSSALWQQFSVLADVVTVDGAAALYREEVPLSYVEDGGLGPARHVFTVNLEYGPNHADVDPFDITVTRPAENDAAHAHDATYLHPVVRHRYDGVETAVHHLAENLDNRWNLPDVHHRPLAAFIEECLAGS